jgi:hypothetical protein
LQFKYLFNIPIRHRKWVKLVGIILFYIYIKFIYNVWWLYDDYAWIVIMIMGCANNLSLHLYEFAICLLGPIVLDHWRDDVDTALGKPGGLKIIFIKYLTVYSYYLFTVIKIKPNPAFKPKMPKNWIGSKNLF